MRFAASRQRSTRFAVRLSIGHSEGTLHPHQCGIKVASLERSVDFSLSLAAATLLSPCYRHPAISLCLDSKSKWSSTRYWQWSVVQLIWHPRASASQIPTSARYICRTHTWFLQHTSASKHDNSVVHLFTEYLCIFYLSKHTSRNLLCLLKPPPPPLKCSPGKARGQRYGEKWQTYVLGTRPHGGHVVYRNIKI